MLQPERVTWMKIEDEERKQRMCKRTRKLVVGWLDEDVHGIAVEG